jgi:hypothetical protein
MFLGVMGSLMRMDVLRTIVRALQAQDRQGCDEKAPSNLGPETSSHGPTGVTPKHCEARPSRKRN